VPRHERDQPERGLILRSMLSVVERTLSWKLRQSLLTTSQFTMVVLVSTVPGVASSLAPPMMKVIFVIPPATAEFGQ
jgi:hypothetical protein